MKQFWILSVIHLFCDDFAPAKNKTRLQQQLAQQKAKLDAREKALNERVNRIVNALADQQKARANARTIPTDPQTQISDPVQVQAERDAAIQQFSAEIRTRPHGKTGWAGTTTGPNAA